MSKIGVLIEMSENAVKDANFGIITAARAQGSNEVFAFTINGEAVDCKDAVEKYGVEKVVDLSADGADLKASPDAFAQAIADAINHFEIESLLGISSTVGRDLMARTAIIQDASLVLDCIEVDLSAATVIKSHFSGKTFAKIKLNGQFKIYGIRPNVIEAQSDACQAEIVAFQSSVTDSGKLKVVELKKSESDIVDLTEANIIVTGGRPLESEDNFGILKACSDLLGGAVGASRAAVDAGYAPHHIQVGQTGKTVSPKLYIGCGISGSVQHFAGMKTSKIIVAINTDKDAPILGKCDYGLIGDLFEVVPALTAELKESQA
jgi:electron transfer flavoprotein alpha subunit